MVVRRYHRGDIERLVNLHSLPGVKEHLHDDIFLDRRMTMAMAVRELIKNPSVYVLGSDPEVMAVSYVPLSGVNYTLHVILHPDFRGKNAIRECVDTAKFMFDKTQCRSILAFARETNVQSRMIAAMSGMRRIGKTTGSFLKDGKLIDEVIYQGTKEDYELWAQQS